MDGVSIVEMESPRMVTAADRWAYRDSPGAGAFPTSVYAKECRDPVIASATMAKIHAKHSFRGSINLTSASGSLPYLVTTADGRTKGTALRPKKTRYCLPLRHYADETSLNGPRSVATTHKATMNAVESDSFPNHGVEHQSTMPLVLKERTQNAGSRRSKAITIAKNRQIVDDLIMDQTCSSMERMYDLATWRMFTRITEHRRRFPIRLRSEQDPVSGRYMFNASTISDELHDINTEQRQETNDRDDYILEGEIFEMEI